MRRKFVFMIRMNPNGIRVGISYRSQQHEYIRENHGFRVMETLKLPDPEPVDPNPPLCQLSIRLDPKAPVVLWLVPTNTICVCRGFPTMEPVRIARRIAGQEKGSSQNRRLSGGNGGRMPLYTPVN
jgi:hypothetical protein